MAKMIANIGRREKSRLRTELRAKLDLVGGAKQCLLSDISKTGARIELSDPPHAGECAFLFAQGIEAFGTIVWRSHKACGLRFDEEIRDGQLIALRQSYEAIDKLEKQELTEFARKWVNGD